MSKSIKALYKFLNSELNEVSTKTAFDIDRKTDLLCFFDAYQAHGDLDSMSVPIEKLRKECALFSNDLCYSNTYCTYFELLDIMSALNFDELMLIISIRIEVEVINDYTSITGYNKFTLYDEKFHTLCSENKSLFLGCSAAIFRNRGIIISKEKKPNLPKQYLKFVKIG